MGWKKLMSMDDDAVTSEEIRLLESTAAYLNGMAVLCLETLVQGVFTLLDRSVESRRGSQIEKILQDKAFFPFTTLSITEREGWLDRFKAFLECPLKNPGPPSPVNEQVFAVPAVLFGWWLNSANRACHSAEFMKQIAVFEDHMSYFFFENSESWFDHPIEIHRDHGCRPLMVSAALGVYVSQVVWRSPPPSGIYSQEKSLGDSPLGRYLYGMWSIARTIHSHYLTAFVSEALKREMAMDDLDPEVDAMIARIVRYQGKDFFARMLGCVFDQIPSEWANSAAPPPIRLIGGQIETMINTIDSLTYHQAYEVIADMIRGTNTSSSE